MAYVNNFTSSKEIIAKIARTFKPNGSSWVSEAIEDMGWAIQAIGYHAGFEKKSTEPPYISIQHNRGKIPCDVERIIAVEYLSPDYNSDNILNPDGTTPYPLSQYNSNCQYKGVRLPLGSDLTGYSLSQDNPRTSHVQPGADYYNLNSDYIVTSFSEGLVRLHYIGFALDKDGLPKILNDADYKMALEWYCIANMILKGYKHPELSFDKAWQFWDMYRLRAENAPKGLSLDGADRFKAGWGRVTTGVTNTEFFMNFEQGSTIGGL